MKISLMAVVAGFGLLVGLPLAATAGPTPGGASAADGDGIEDFFDNCQLDSNAAQKDFDHDGCGDVCDSDANNDGTAGSADFTAFRATFQKSEGDVGYNANFDSNCDGTVGSADFTNFRGNFQLATGPSGFPAAQRGAIGGPACPGAGCACPGPNP